MSKDTKFLLKFLFFLGFGVFAIFFGRLALFYFVSHNVSSEPKYAEIYHQTFVVQNPIYLKQWSDSKIFYLEKNDYGKCIATLETGTKLYVKKITKKYRWAGTSISVLVDTDKPDFHKSVDASNLVLDIHLGYSDDLAQFDPEYLKNSVVRTLHMAVQYEDFEAIKQLIAKGAVLNEQNLDGRTPLHYAKQADVVLYLLEQGASPDISDKWGKTLLHYAAQNHQSDIVKLLLQKGAQIDPKDKQGDTPTLVAAEAQDFDTVRFLLESGADPRVKGRYQNTVLLYAAQYDQLEIAELSLSLGADPLAVCELSGMTGVLFAARNHNLEMAKFFVKAGAPVDCANKGSSETPLHYVAGNVELLKYFLENGADIHRTNHHGRTVFHRAVRYNNLDVIQFLYEKGGQINQKDNFGETPFLEAIGVSFRDQNLEIVKWMTLHGADLSITDREGRGPLQYALDFGCESPLLQELVDWLCAHGANP